ncbi:hypothetical protein Taro_022836 [Colocasia esculenta]|uniref:Uncharacterized protein n=1 Tax=Colocasia esculenta TaxID=4460 RepID=A0A843UVK7_COLES|nr:hypothetical protein [Colocasia esculenta]
MAHFPGAARARSDVGAGAHLVATAIVLGLQATPTSPVLPFPTAKWGGQDAGKRGWTSGGGEECSVEGEEGGGETEDEPYTQEDGNDLK